MEATEQQQMIRAIAERLVQVAPEGWARLVGNWEASLVDDEVSLNWITLGVVDLGDRWGGGWSVRLRRDALRPGRTAQPDDGAGC